MAEEQVLPDELLQMATAGMSATDRGEYDAGLQLLSHVYQQVKQEAYPKALSSYGLCLAKAGGKNRAGAEACEAAIKLQFYEGRHWANLVRVYIAAKNRRKAVDVLDKGLKKMRNDPELLRVRDEIGYRKTPYFQFMSRTNPVNRLYSKSIGKLQRRGKIIAAVIAALLYLAAMAGVFMAILE